MQKHVAKIIIQEAFNEIDLDIYQENLTFLAQRKFTETKGTLFERKVKTARFLAGKGYEFDLIQDVLEHLS